MITRRDTKTGGELIPPIKNFAIIRCLCTHLRKQWTLTNGCLMPLGKNKKSMYMCHDPVSINIHMLSQYPLHMPQERMVLCSGCSGEGSRPQLSFKQVSNQCIGRAKHMLAMLWLELASLVFNGCGFDPFGLQAQSSQSKISGLPLFPEDR